MKPSSSVSLVKASVLRMQGESFLDAFFKWVKQMEQKDVFTFAVKTGTTGEVVAAFSQPADYSTSITVV